MLTPKEAATDASSSWMRFSVAWRSWHSEKSVAVKYLHDVVTSCWDNLATDPQAYARLLPSAVRIPSDVEYDCSHLRTKRLLQAQDRHACVETEADGISTWQVLSLCQDLALGCSLRPLWLCQTR